MMQNAHAVARSHYIHSNVLHSEEKPSASSVVPDPVPDVVPLNASRERRGGLNFSSRL